MAKYFYLDSSPIYKDKYVIRLNHELFPFLTPIKGSYNIIIARLLNLSYADYLRYSRDRLGADLIGKGHRYVVPYYDKNNNTEALIKLLNSRAKYVLKQYEDPYEYKEDKEGNVTKVLLKNEDFI